MNLLILTVTAGHGHNQTAKSIYDYATSHGHNALVLDALEMGAIFEEQPVKEGYLIAEPVIVNGDLLGTVIVVSKVQLDENKLGYIRFASAVLGAVVGQ